MDPTGSNPVLSAIFFKGLKDMKDQVNSDLKRLKKNMKMMLIKNICDKLRTDQSAYYDAAENCYVSLVYTIPFVGKSYSENSSIRSFKDLFQKIKDKFIAKKPEEKQNIGIDWSLVSYIVMCKARKAERSDTGYFFNFYVLDRKEFMLSQAVKTDDNVFRWVYNKPLDMIEVYADYDSEYPRVHITIENLSSLIPEDSEFRAATKKFIEYMKHDIWPGCFEE